ncbi:MAG: nucleoid-associated protein [Gammaproteobacteria bacterium]|nr:nucleoid-associated protein [Gammaproteobacteria bacterium]
MPITHVIAHHISKQTDEDAILSLRDSELANNTQQSSLFDSLKTSLNARISRKHGSFDNNIEAAILADEIESLLKDKTQFKLLSTRFMKNLETLLNQHNGDINAHFLFFLEENEKQNVFYLFIVNQNEYLTINETLEITPIYSIDTGSSLSGLKLNIDDWQQRPKYHYLTLVPPKGNEVLSDALHDLSGFGNSIDRAKSTKEFLDNLDAFSQHIPAEKQKEFREQVIGYCEEQESKDEAVHIPTLSESISQSVEGIDCEKFIREMLPHNPERGDDDADESEQELMIDKGSLRRYIKFSGRDKDLSLTFSTNQLDESVFYNEQDESLTIKNIPKGLKKQLVSHFKRLAHGSYK